MSQNFFKVFGIQINFPASQRLNDWQLTPCLDQTKKNVTVLGKRALIGWALTASLVNPIVLP